MRVEEHATDLADKVRWAGAAWATSDRNADLATEDGSAVAVVTVTGEAESGVELRLENTLVIDTDLASTGAESAAVQTLTGAAVVAILACAFLVRTRRRAA